MSNQGSIVAFIGCMELARPGQCFRKWRTTTMDDGQLVQRVLQGDGDAFSVLFQRYNPFICRIISHIVRNQQDMEDVAGSAWEKAWKNLSTLRDRSSFKSYLTTIGKREAIDHIRRKGRKQEDSDEEIDELVDQRNV